MTTSVHTAFVTLPHHTTEGRCAIFLFWRLGCPNQPQTESSKIYIFHRALLLQTFQRNDHIETCIQKRPLLRKYSNISVILRNGLHCHYIITQFFNVNSSTFPVFLHNPKRYKILRKTETQLKQVCRIESRSLTVAQLALIGPRIPLETWAKSARARSSLFLITRP